MATIIKQEYSIPHNWYKFCMCKELDNFLSGIYFSTLVLVLIYNSLLYSYV
jgi:hypothetical protein